MANSSADNGRICKAVIVDLLPMLESSLREAMMQSKLRFDSSSIPKSIAKLYEMIACERSLDHKESHKQSILLLKATVYSKIYAYPFSLVPDYYLEIFADSCILLGILGIKDNIQAKSIEEVQEEFFKCVDIGLIVAGQLISNRRRQIVEDLATAFRNYDRSNLQLNEGDKLCSDEVKNQICQRYSHHIQRHMQVLTRPSHIDFEKYIESFQKSKRRRTETLQESDSGLVVEPLYLKGVAEQWPAFKKWNCVNYLLMALNNGLRLVPIEIGDSYVSERWSQQIMPFRKVLSSWIDNVKGESIDERNIYYLAQYDLLTQIPFLRKDILVPDYVFCDFSTSEYGTNRRKGNVSINSWVGPEGTISPLHTDAHDNILVQVVGYKYVRLYSRTLTKYQMYPISNSKKKEAEGNLDSSETIDMSNTSSVELEKGCFGAFFGDEDVSHLAELGDDFDFNAFSKLRERIDPKRIYREKYDKFPWESDYFECILGPGDALFIPCGWWHYVKSLSPSFSVSFWF
ncbi:hypothetical protein V1511DRAFT_495154 [Dipodascopsis uninucleata]